MRKFVLLVCIGIGVGLLAYAVTRRKIAAEPVAHNGDQIENSGLVVSRPTLRLQERTTNGIDTQIADQPNVPGEFFDPELLRSNRVYRARVMKHIDVRYYEKSPAKDTTECQTIKEMLTKEGVGTDAVGDAYNAAWDYALAVDAAAKAGVSDQIITRMVRNDASDKLRKKYGITNDAFFDALFQIQPKIFFGQKNLALPEPGERLAN